MRHRVRLLILTLLLTALGALVGSALVAVPTARAETTAPPTRWPITLTLPVSGAVLAPFEAPTHRYAAGHRGVDLAAATGDTVRAGAAGTVTFVGQVAGRGVVTIDHGGIETTYEPLAPRVQRGQSVQTGEVIGTVATGSHTAGIHWGLRRGRDYADPMLHLAASPPGPIRLLPLSAQPVPVLATVPAGLPTMSGAGGVPADGPITSRFGMRLHPVLHIWKLHDGTDVGAPCGAPVRSFGAGTVVQVTRHVAYGNWIIVDVGQGRRYGYAHLTATAVSVGQSVGAGQVIGSVGTTGWSTGCHLHFMAWQNGAIIAPPIGG